MPSYINSAFLLVGLIYAHPSTFRQTGTLGRNWHYSNNSIAKSFFVNLASFESDRDLAQYHRSSDVHNYLLQAAILVALEAQEYLQFEYDLNHSLSALEFAARRQDLDMVERRNGEFRTLVCEASESRQKRDLEFRKLGLRLRVIQQDIEADVVQANVKLHLPRMDSIREFREERSNNSIDQLITQSPALSRFTVLAKQDTDAAQAVSNQFTQALSIACRTMEGHSQSLSEFSSNVSPTTRENLLRYYESVTLAAIELPGGATIRTFGGVCDQVARSEGVCGVYG